MAFHFTHTLLESGSVILPGNYGRVLREAGQGHQNALRESILEAVRLQNFSTLPSRLDAAFYFDKVEGVRAYQSVQQLQFVNWYEVERLDGRTEETMSDFRRVQPIGPLGFEWASAYWRGEPWPLDGDRPAHHFIESFSVSRLRVIRRLSNQDLDL